MTDTTSPTEIKTKLRSFLETLADTLETFCEPGTGYHVVPVREVDEHGCSDAYVAIHGTIETLEANRNQSISNDVRITVLLFTRDPEHPGGVLGHVTLLPLNAGEFAFMVANKDYMSEETFINRTVTLPLVGVPQAASVIHQNAIAETLPVWFVNRVALSAAGSPDFTLNDFVTATYRRIYHSFVSETHEPVLLGTAPDNGSPSYLIGVVEKGHILGNEGRVLSASLREHRLVVLTWIERFNAKLDTESCIRIRLIEPLAGDVTEDQIDEAYDRTVVDFDPQHTYELTSACLNWLNPENNGVSDDVPKSEATIDPANYENMGAALSNLMELVANQYHEEDPVILIDAPSHEGMEVRVITTIPAELLPDQESGDNSLNYTMEQVGGRACVVVAYTSGTDLAEHRDAEYYIRLLKPNELDDYDPDNAQLVPYPAERIQDAVNDIIRHLVL